MKRFLSLRSLSRTVHDDHDYDDDDDDQRRKGDVVISGGSNKCTSTLLTVWRKSLVISCNGFTVIDSNGDLIYRVDNYIGRPKEIILMDASGKSLLTMRRRKKLGLVDSWFVYEGEASDHQYNCKMTTKSSSISKLRPIFLISKNINLVINNTKPHVLAHIYRNSKDKKCAFAIEGSYSHRFCKVFDNCSKKVVAETRRKQEIFGGVSYGVEVFQLIVQPEFDPRFAMALVLLLDQMFS